MKVAFSFVAIVALCSAAPRDVKPFHEHIGDFLDIIMEEAGDDIEHVFSHYKDNEEFQKSLEYMVTTDFKDLVLQMEELPEMKALNDYLDTHGIDIYFIIEEYNRLLEGVVASGALDRSSPRHEVSGTNFHSFIEDTISELPKEKLKALWDQKVEDDEDFRTAVESLETEEFTQLLDALFESETFQEEVQTVANHGIDLDVLLEQLRAFFGQN